MRRLVVAATMAVALAVGGSAATLVTSTAAWANSSVSCGKLTGYSRGAYKFQLKRCTPTSAERTLSGLGADLVRVGGPISHSWEWNGGATTIVSVTVVQSGTCPAGYTAYSVTGTVTGGTSTYTHVGDSIQMSVCRRGSRYMYQVRLATGSTVSL
jgi:hypothetical protein